MNIKKKTKQTPFNFPMQGLKHQENKKNESDSQESPQSNVKNSRKSKSDSGLPESKVSYPAQTHISKKYKRPQQTSLPPAFGIKGEVQEGTYAKMPLGKVYIVQTQESKQFLQGASGNKFSISSKNVYSNKLKQISNKDFEKEAKKRGRTESHQHPWVEETVNTGQVTMPGQKNDHCWLEVSPSQRQSNKKEDQGIDVTHVHVKKTHLSPSKCSQKGELQIQCNPTHCNIKGLSDIEQRIQFSEEQYRMLQKELALESEQDDKYEAKPEQPHQNILGEQRTQKEKDLGFFGHQRTDKNSYSYKSKQYAQEYGEKALMGVAIVANEARYGIQQAVRKAKDTIMKPEQSPEKARSQAMPLQYYEYNPEEQRSHPYTRLESPYKVQQIKLPEEEEAQIQGEQTRTTAIQSVPENQTLSQLHQQKVLSQLQQDLYPEQLQQSSDLERFFQWYRSQKDQQKEGEEQKEEISNQNDNSEEQQRQRELKSEHLIPGEQKKPFDSHKRTFYLRKGPMKQEQQPYQQDMSKEPKLVQQSVIGVSKEAPASLGIAFQASPSQQLKKEDMKEEQKQQEKEKKEIKQEWLQRTPQQKAYRRIDEQLLQKSPDHFTMQEAKPSIGKNSIQKIKGKFNEFSKAYKPTVIKKFCKPLKPSQQKEQQKKQSKEKSQKEKYRSYSQDSRENLKSLQQGLKYKSILTKDELQQLKKLGKQKFISQSYAPEQQYKTQNLESKDVKKLQENQKLFSKLPQQLQKDIQISCTKVKHELQKCQEHQQEKLHENIRGDKQSKGLKQDWNITFGNSQSSSQHEKRYLNSNEPQGCGRSHNIFPIRNQKLKVPGQSFDNSKRSDFTYLKEQQFGKQYSVPTTIGLSAPSYSLKGRHQEAHRKDVTPGPSQYQQYRYRNQRSASFPKEERNIEFYDKSKIYFPGPGQYKIPSTLDGPSYSLHGFRKPKKIEITPSGADYFQMDPIIRPRSSTTTFSKQRRKSYFDIDKSNTPGPGQYNFPQTFQTKPRNINFDKEQQEEEQRLRNFAQRKQQQEKKQPKVKQFYESPASTLYKKYLDKVKTEIPIKGTKLSQPIQQKDMDKEQIQGYKFFKGQKLEFKMYSRDIPQEIDSQ